MLLDVRRTLALRDCVLPRIARRLAHDRLVLPWLDIRALCRRMGRDSVFVGVGTVVVNGKRCTRRHVASPRKFRLIIGSYDEPLGLAPIETAPALAWY